LPPADAIRSLLLVVLIMQGAAKFPRACLWPVKLCPAIIALSFAVSLRGDTFTVSNTNLTGAGSLKQAIISANANPGTDTIVFQISGTPPFTISPTNALDAIADSVVIDGTTQPGYTSKPVIELNGANAGSGTIGLRFASGASTLHGLAINRFKAAEIQLDSPSNTIVGNFIGTDVTGSLARAGGSHGIWVNTAGNLIGGTNSGDGNVISGNGDDGIYLLSCSGNVVQGNLIGVNAAGTAALGNANNGIVIYSASSNLIGGPFVTASNIISGNGQSGVYITGTTAAGNVIQGNRIGTDRSGSNAVANAADDGISIIYAPGNVISSNQISGNALSGVSIQGAGAIGNVVTGNLIGTAVDGKIALANHNSGVSISGAGGNQIGGTNAGEGNVISGNSMDGITLTGGTKTNLVQGNFIGVTATGTAALRNGQNGITCSGAMANTIGGAITAARNIISGNTSNGVGIFQTSDSGNMVLGNYIGLDVTGTQPIANKLAGVYVQGSSNTIGGTVSGAGNVISGNTHQGIWIVGTSGNAKGNVIQGNRIGVTPTGAVAMGNGLSTGDSAGIGISTASANVIGGSAPSAGNVISGNNGAGIFLLGATASSNVVQGNFIGTDTSGTASVGNIWEGIYIDQAGTNQIGGGAAGMGNLISGNYAQGIYLTNADWNVIQGNFIGTKADGTNNLANRLHNVELQNGATHNVIGGTNGAGNRLAYASMNYNQLYCGVRVRTGAAQNLISGNSIFSNGALGIDLSPPTDSAFANGTGVNPILGCESGVVSVAANDGQNFPTLSNVVSGTITRVRGSLNSSKSTAYTLQFFASPAGDSSGYGEGQVYLGQTNLTIGSASCSSNFTAYLPASVPEGWVVTATATDSSNNTSEFSAAAPVTAVPPVQLASSGIGQLNLSWTNNGGSFAVQQTYSLNPPVTWATVTNVPVLVNNFLVTTLGLTNSSVYYRLMVP
jgi:parallel beta-helix repeat protein